MGTWQRGKTRGITVDSGRMDSLDGWCVAPEQVSGGSMNRFVGLEKCLTSEYIKDDA